MTQCGHLYCWPCLFRWLNSNHTTCPVCKAGVTQENVIPIFLSSAAGKGPSVTTNRMSHDKAETENRHRSEEERSAEAIPNRPPAHRPEPMPLFTGNNNMNGNYATQFGGVSFSTGFGFFPSLFGLQFQSFIPQPNNDAGLNPDEELHKTYLSRFLYGLTVAVVVCLLIF